jgi:malate dehydrogenase
MDIAIIGASGSCGRQLAAQVLDRRIIAETGRMQLVGRHGGASERELFGLRADLSDAFVDHAPRIEVVLDPEAVDADIVVMLAGLTISTDPGKPVDRVGLGTGNLDIFRTYASALDPDHPPVVIVQSNPVELGVHVFAERLGAKSVLGAGALSDTLRFRQEIAEEFGVRRTQVTAPMLGQHGDHLVPLWSRVRVHGRTDVAGHIAHLRRGRSLADLPREIQDAKTHMVALVMAERVDEAYAYVMSLPPDLRAAVKPFFTHFTAGRTTEMATAHSVADLVEIIATGRDAVVPAQVRTEGIPEGISGICGLPVMTSSSGWTDVVQAPIADDEYDALLVAAQAIDAANAAIMGATPPDLTGE